MKNQGAITIKTSDVYNRTVKTNNFQAFSLRVYPEFQMDLRNEQKHNLASTYTWNEIAYSFESELVVIQATYTQVLTLKMVSVWTGFEIVTYVYKIHKTTI